MVLRTIAHLYDSYEDAKLVVSDLEAAGIPHNDISLMANAEAHSRASATSAATGAETHTLEPADRAHTNAGTGTGAVLGTALGGGVGLLAGIGALAIPGVGPVVAAGWLVATLTGAGVGAASGGLLGLLTGAGVSKDEAHVYAEGVRRGSSLVTVRVNDANASRVEALMAQHRPVDWQQRRTSYGPDWTGFDERVTGLPPGSTATGVNETTPGTTYPPDGDPNRRL